jgi:hypothetical protein
MDTVARTIRSIEIDDAGAARAANAIEDRYNDTLDVVVARQAFPRAPIATTGDENVHSSFTLASAPRTATITR